jgi:hypothetical protein
LRKERRFIGCKDGIDSDVNDDCGTVETGVELDVVKVFALKACDGRHVEGGEKAETEGDLKPESS